MIHSLSQIMYEVDVRIRDKAGCRTAPATQGVSIRFVFLKLFQNSVSSIFVLKFPVDVVVVFLRGKSHCGSTFPSEDGSF